MNDKWKDERKEGWMDGWMDENLQVFKGRKNLETKSSSSRFTYPDVYRRHTRSTTSEHC